MWSRRELLTMDIRANKRLKDVYLSALYMKHTSHDTYRGRPTCIVASNPDPAGLLDSLISRMRLWIYTYFSLFGSAKYRTCVRMQRKVSIIYKRCEFSGGNTCTRQVHIADLHRHYLLNVVE